MKLHCYGDSWTEGVGVNFPYENNLKDRIQLQLYRNQYSWPLFLSKKLGLEMVNNGWSGKANNVIFNEIISDVRNDKIKKGEFVVIMWSSTLRDYVPFLPKGEWISWGNLELEKLPQKFIESYQYGDEKFNSFLAEYKRFFLSNLFNQNYYNIINQNYIIFLQKILEEYDINYLMCDGFDLMIQKLNKEDDITHLINKTRYWEFGKKSLESWLFETHKNLPIWEDKVPNPIEIAQHPNVNGYSLIADELYRFINTNKLI